MMMNKEINVGSADDIDKLWDNEVCRVFYDRLSTAEDKEWLAKLVVQYAGKYLKSVWEYDDVFIKGQNRSFWQQTSAGLMCT